MYGIETPKQRCLKGLWYVDSYCELFNGMIGIAYFVSIDNQSHILTKFFLMVADEASCEVFVKKKKNH